MKQFSLKICQFELCFHTRQFSKSAREKVLFCMNGRPEAYPSSESSVLTGGRACNECTALV